MVGNFHTTVNCVRWLKAAPFVVQSHFYSSSLIFFRPLKWEPQAAGFSHWNKTEYILCPALSISPLSCQQRFHRHVSNLIATTISCHVQLAFNNAYVINFVVFLMILWIDLGSFMFNSMHEYWSLQYMIHDSRGTNVYTTNLFKINV